MKKIVVIIALIVAQQMAAEAYLAEINNESNGFLEIEISYVDADPGFAIHGSQGVCVGGSQDNKVHIGCSPYIIKPKTKLQLSGYRIPNPQQGIIKVTAYKPAPGEFGRKSWYLQEFSAPGTIYFGREQTVQTANDSKTGFNTRYSNNGASFGITLTSDFNFKF